MYVRNFRSLVFKKFYQIRINNMKKRQKYPHSALNEYHHLHAHADIAAKNIIYSRWRFEGFNYNSANQRMLNQLETCETTWRTSFIEHERFL